MRSHRRGDREGTSIILGRIRHSGITFQQIQQHSGLVVDLVLIGSIPAIRDGFLTRRTGHVSSEDESAAPSDDHEGEPAQAQEPERRRRRREEEDEQPVQHRLRPRHN